MFLFHKFIRLGHEIFRCFKYHAQNLNTRKIIRRAGTYIWDLTGF